jgi:hypothetical protein
MLNAWMSAMMLAVESANVIGLRLTKIASGGIDAQVETSLMVHEKLSAAFEAQASLCRGGTASSIIERYRELVAENARRLEA